MIELGLLPVIDDWLVADEQPSHQAPFVGIAPAPKDRQDEVVIVDGAGSTAGGRPAFDAGGATTECAPSSASIRMIEAFEGTADNDILTGSASGGPGDDILIGHSGSRLYGGDGNDILDAMAGDTLVGGAGADIFLLTLGDECCITIRDFAPDHGDIVAILNAPADLTRDGAMLVSGGRVLVEFDSAGMAAAAIGEVANV